jgi:hypothetical protein
MRISLAALGLALAIIVPPPAAGGSTWPSCADATMHPDATVGDYYLEVQWAVDPSVKVKVDAYRERNAFPGLQLTTCEAGDGDVRAPDGVQMRLVVGGCGAAGADSICDVDCYMDGATVPDFSFDPRVKDAARPFVDPLVGAGCYDRFWLMLES